MRKKVIAGILLLVFLLPSWAAATELGLTSYPDGIENFACGALPPPGGYFLNYLLFYPSNHFPPSSPLNPPNPKAFVFAEVLRFIYVTKIQILGASLGTHLVVPLVYTSLKSTLQGMTLVDNDSFGLANTAFDPFILGWHFDDFHVTTALEILFPGTYNRFNPASPSRHYFTFQSILALGYMPKWGLGVNIKMMYDLPTINYDPLAVTGAQNSYQSGQAFHFDYCVDYEILPKLRLGATGYYYWQTTPDYRDGARIGHFGREFAIGPGIKYDFKKLCLAVTSQFELAAINRPEGIRNWVRLWYAF